jgi:hypothetical protein
VRDNLVVQSLWVGKRLPLLQQTSLASFMAAGHEYHLYVYDDVLDVPSGALLPDAESVLPRAAVVRDPGRPGYAGFSDLFRCQLLLNKGGWWVDTDFICLRPFDFPCEYVFSSEHTADGGSIPNSGAIRCPPGCAALEFMVRECQRKDLRTINWGELGPQLIAKAIKKYDLHAYVRPPEAFCPVSYFRFWDLLKADALRDLPSDSYAVHLWNAMWPRMKCDPDAAYHPRSAYEGWKLQFLGGARP